MFKLLLEQTTEMPTTGEDNPAACLVKVYRGVGTAKGKIVVVATDQGNSSVVSNKVEEIATQTCRTHNIKPEDLVFIERRMARPSFEETFDLVHLDWNASAEVFKKPEWSKFTKEATEAITGETL
jgi:hypothetical protein